MDIFFITTEFTFLGFRFLDNLRTTVFTNAAFHYRWLFRRFWFVFIEVRISFRLMYLQPFCILNPTIKNS